MLTTTIAIVDVEIAIGKMEELTEIIIIQEIFITRKLADTGGGKMSISEHRDEDQELLRQYCIDILADEKESTRDKNNAAKLLARMQKLLQKDSEDASKKEDEVDDRELTDEESKQIQDLITNGES